MSDNSTTSPTIAPVPPRDPPPPVPEDGSATTAADAALIAALVAAEEEPTNSPPDTSQDAALAASLAAQEETATTTPNKVANASAPWQYDDLNEQCRGCHEHFHALNRRHHCRFCGNVFCHTCTNQKALLPPDRIVLHPVLGKQVQSTNAGRPTISFTPDPDPDRMLTYTSDDGHYVRGHGLEERCLLAREPLRVCRACHHQLQPLQPDLRAANSNAVRSNTIDPTALRRWCNSPVAFTLGHEIRKAAYTLNNLLPQPKRRMGAFVPVYTNNYDPATSMMMMEHTMLPTDTCANMVEDQCGGARLTPNLNELDGVRIPATLMERAMGIAVVTSIKAGVGVAGAELGTGLAVARSAAGWSAPTAIGMLGLSWGALVGAQLADHVFLLMDATAVGLFFGAQHQVQLGADVGVAVGPVGRAVEGDWSVGSNSQAAPVYTYSLSKGLYAGVSLDGKVVVARDDVNEKFYGTKVKPADILAGAVPPPPAAQPLYEALQRCHVYASQAGNPSAASTLAQQRLNDEYGEFQNMPPEV